MKDQITKIGILTTSDRASQGICEALSRKTIKNTPTLIDLREGPFLKCDESIIKIFRPKLK